LNDPQENRTPGVFGKKKANKNQNKKKKKANKIKQIKKEKKARGKRAKKK